MPKTAQELVAFNRGRVSELALARVDLKRVQLSAEEQTNWMPRALGSMMLRPGLGYTGATAGHNPSRSIPFVFGNDDTARIEVTTGKIRIWIDDELLARPSVTAAITNGAFTSNLTGWTDADDVGATSDWNAGGYMQLNGDGSVFARRRQQVTCYDFGIEHALRIVIFRGPVTLRIGSSAGDDDFFESAELGAGEHSISFTPTADFHIELSASRIPVALIDSVTIESAGTVEVAAPWDDGDLDFLRSEQSGDVVYIACNGVQQRKIERRGDRPGARGWSVVLYEPENGPYRNANLGPTTLTPSATTGDITLTASDKLFRAGHLGALFQITQAGQRVTRSISAQNTFSDAIRVTGVGTSRTYSFNVSGTFTATWTLQRSVGEEGNWEDIASSSATVDSATADGLDNQIVFYRIGVKTGNYTSGTLTVTLVFALGSTVGVVRITSVTNELLASAQVLVPLGGTGATDEWAEGAWSDYRGFPSAVALHEGRLWWAGKDKIWGSVSDDFENFDPETEGDSGPLSRSIGQGPVDHINWLVSAARLILGADMTEFSARSSGFDEILTPTNLKITPISDNGGANVAGLRVDGGVVFVDRSTYRVYRLDFDAASNDYQPEDLAKLIPDIGSPGFVRMAVQRKPDIRLHCVRSDGTAGVLIFDKTENVICWIDAESPGADGLIEDVCVLPASAGEDQVYYTIARSISGATVRYHEKWALESECRGETLNKQADSFIVFTNSPASATVPGLEHLEGEEVVVWAGGICLTDEDGEIETFTVSGGQIALTHEGASYAATTGVVGLSYEARYKSTKLAYAAAGGSALGKVKRIDHVSPILAYTHARGLQYGSAFDSSETMDPLPDIEDGTTVDGNYIWRHYDKGSTEFPGEWDTDSRLCFLAQAPRPVTVLGVVLDMQTNG